MKKSLLNQIFYVLLFVNYSASYGQNQNDIVDQAQSNTITLEQNRTNQDASGLTEGREMLETDQTNTPEQKNAEEKSRIKPISTNEGINMQSNKPAIQANIGISEPNREKVGALLNRLLSDEFILYIKTLNYHWNVRDMYFSAMHKFFEKLYEKQLDISDEVAERARALGVVSFGTAQEFLKNSQLKEQPGLVPATKEMLKNLLEDHEAIIRSIRIDAEKCLEYEDMGTNNFLTELIEKHEKIAWMLRSGFEQEQ